MRHQLRIILVSCFCIPLFACVSANKESKRLPNSADKDVTLTLRQTSPNQFRVTYQLKSPVQVLKFSRDWNPFRHKTWKSLTPDIKISVNSKGVEYIAHNEGRSFSQVSFEVAPYTKNLKADYEAFIKFTDGSYAAYPGSLEIEKLDSLDTAKSMNFRHRGPTVKTLSHVFISDPGTARKIIVLGKTYDSATPFNEPYYVYFGSIQIKQIGESLALIDPGAPEWAVTTFTNSLQAASNYLLKRLRTPPKEKAFVALTFQVEPTLKNLEIGGGLLTFQNNKSIWVSITANSTKANSSHAKPYPLKNVTVHEFVHFWEQFSENNSTQSAWYAEGSAVALTRRFLLINQDTDEEKYWSDHNRSAKHCVKNYKHPSSFVRFSNDDDYWINYSCGALIALVVERILISGDYFDFYQAINEAALKTRGQFTNDLYFRVLRKMSDQHDTIGLIEDFLKEAGKNSNEKLKTLLTRAGLTVTDSSIENFSFHK